MDINRNTKQYNLTIQYNRGIFLNFADEVESWFQEEWDKHMANASLKNILLFNGPLFHVANIEREADNIILKLVNTDYRTYVCSRGIEFKNRFPNCTSSKPLAACVAIVTSDNKLLIEKRKGVDVHEGMFHVVGGFLDPSKDVDKSGMPDPTHSILREVTEETGIELSQKSLIFLGIAEDTNIPHYELCFLSITALSSKEVLEIIKNSTTDGEFNTPVFVDFTRPNIVEFMKTKGDLFSPTGRDCIEMAISKVYN